MMFWFKRKEVVLDFFVSNGTLYDVYHPRKAALFMPDWWKHLESSYERFDLRVNATVKAATMKHCLGIKNLYSSGFIIPLWTDLDLRVDKEGYRWVFADGRTVATEHSAEQHGNSFPSFHHIKLDSPWYAREKHGIKFAFIEPFWGLNKFNNHIIIPPAITTYDCGGATNVNIFLRKEEQEYRLEMEAGTELAHLIPLTDKKVKIKTHLVTEPEYLLIKSHSGANKFFKSGETYKKLMKKFKNGN